MKTVKLQTVDAFVAFDLDCPISAGGTRLAPDVSEREAQLLARAMTYKFAVLGIQIGGAKGAIRAAPEDREEAIRRYCQEILPWVKKRRFLTATDLGTWPADFQSLPGGDDQGLMDSTYHGMPLDAYITGVGVATAAEVVMGGLEGRTVAIEGFGKVGAAVAVEVARRGARLVAFSTVHGCVYKQGGFDVEDLLQARSSHGDLLVHHVNGEVHPPAELFAIDADILVPGARVGVVNESRAPAIKARLVAPAANVPYTAAGLQVLARRGIPALADFVCNSGATIGYMTDLKTAAEAIDVVERRVAELTRSTLQHPGGPLQGAWAIAEEHLRKWVPDQIPDGPPLAA